MIVSVELMRVAGAYLVWDAHLGSHFCPVAAGDGRCAAGEEILRRLHTAIASLEPEERAAALEAVREWDWEPEAPYPSEDEA